MELPLQITFRHMEPSAAIEARVQEHAQKLERFYDHIVSCRVVIEAPHKHHHKGRVYHARVDMTVKDGKLVATREPEHNHAHEDVYVAIRDSFEAIRRQLDGYVSRRRGAVKVHDEPPHGHVIRLDPQRDFGTIQSSDGREVYFHRNSVLNGHFDELEVGTEVRFAEESGDTGPRASTVHLVGKHHAADS
jgi:ribosomal subunit interface protein